MSEVRKWLTGIGLAQYADAFEANDIDMDLLKEVDEQALKDIGISSTGHRLRIRKAIAKLVGASTGEANPSNVSEPERQATTAERRQLTVMFCDLVGSTTLSARLDPEDMREIIGAYHRCCAEAITKAGGFVAKYMGDGVLAYFGYPQAHEDDAERAVRGALSLVETISNLPIKHDATLNVRIGIATGLVVVGDLIGEGDAQERGVVGDTPNLAARLQALAEPGQIMISQSTRRLAGGLFEYRDLGRVTLKGLPVAVQAWQVTGTSAVQSRFDAQQESSLTPLMGREEELELLLRRWRRAQNGEGQVVLVSGEPGIGKSRLTVALQERLQGEPHTRLRYFCSPHHSDSALYPTISHLERAAGFDRNDTPDAKLEKLTSLLSAVSEHESEVPLIAELLSIPTGERYAPLSVSPQRKKEKTFEALLAQLEVLARQRPVLMVYEDVHWNDPSSRELLDMTVERVARLPVLLVITFRPEFQPPWIGQAHVTNVSLNRLNRRDGAALVGSVAGNNPLADEIMEEIVERTDGVPLFVEELTKAVLEAGVDDPDRRGTVSTVPLPALAVPVTLHALLMARLDRIGPVAKEIAQIGAAIGREFSYELLAPVAQKSDADLQAALRRLSETGLVFSRGTPPQATFLFKHALVRDAAYGTLLRGPRQQIHLRIGKQIERCEPDTAATQPERLAYHFQEAGHYPSAFGYWVAAGDLAARRSASREAVSHYQSALALVSRVADGNDALQRELDLNMNVANALLQTEGYTSEKAQEHYKRARRIAKELGQTDRYVSAHLGGGGAVAQGRYTDLINALADISPRELAELRPITKVHYGYRMGVLHSLLGRFNEAWDAIDAAIRLDDSVNCTHEHPSGGGDPAIALRFYGNIVRSAQGYLLQAERLADEAVSIARRRGHAFTIIWATLLEISTMADRGELVQADERATELIEQCTRHGYEARVGNSLLLRGPIRIRLGRIGDGIVDLRQGLELWIGAGGKFHAAQYCAQCGNELIKAQRYREAEEFVLRGEEMQRETEERCHEAELLRLRAMLLAVDGRHGQASECLYDALNVAERSGAKLFKLRASASLARLWRDQGKRAEARDLLAPIYGWFTEGFDTPDLKDAKALLEELGA
jgi:class 3 adenylate cyclase/tetratricopeptide (TPR) repeat protein